MSVRDSVLFLLLFTFNEFPAFSQSFTDKLVTTDVASASDTTPTTPLQTPTHDYRGLPQDLFCAISTNSRSIAGTRSGIRWFQ